MSQPLSGVRVLDMSRLLPGPFCTQILCDLGAEVIKVEDFDGGDYARMYPPLTADGNSAIFHGLNRGKKSVQLDLKKKEDHIAFLELLKTADVLLETFRPGVMKKLGLEPTELLKRYPSLIVCSISGYGQTGPDSLRAGHDVNYLAKSGALGLMARPSLLPVQVADIAGGSYPAAIQILAALRQKERTGQGSIIDVSMTDNVYSLLTMAVSRYNVSKEPFGQGRDLLVGGTPCYEIYPTRDGFISVGSLEPKFWSAFCKAIQRPDLIAQQFPSTPEENQRTKTEVESVLKTKTNDEWRAFFQTKDCCVEIIERPEQITSTNPQLAARDVNLTLQFPDGTSFQTPNTPIRMTGVQPNTRIGPGLGQHNQELLRKIQSKL